LAHDPFAELPDKDRVPRSSRVLDAWVNDAQKILGIRGSRVGWLLASTLAAAALQRETEDGTPLFLVKGGTYIERALDLRARATKDLDTLYRGSTDDLEDRIDISLARPWDEIQFSRTAVETIESAPRVRKPRRFKVNLDIRGVRWRSIQVEVSFDEGSAGDHLERITSPATGFLGISHPDDLVTISMAYQVAQKLHACTDPHDPPAFRNERVRDIVDLILIRDAFYPDGTDLAPVKAAAVDVFAVRAAEAEHLGHAARRWPPIIASNEVWRSTCTSRQTRSASRCC
jgi:hypothetical protein